MGFVRWVLRFPKNLQATNYNINVVDFLRIKKGVKMPKKLNKKEEEVSRLDNDKPSVIAGADESSDFDSDLDEELEDSEDADWE